ncbi:MAG: DUF4139 domain-containing protein [Candidatus Eisenbacteria bacterium]
MIRSRPTAALIAVVMLAASAAQAGPALSIYSSDLGFVKESRTLMLAGSRDTVRLEDISNRLDFSSVRLALASGRVTRLAYRWDIATGEGLIERAIGQRVRVVVRGERVAEGTLLAADGSWLVLRGDDGAIATLSRAQVDEVRLAMPAASLSLKPALEAVLEGVKKGPVEAQLSYLTGGLSWSAEHTFVRTGENSGQWSATVQIQNTTGRDYRDARVKLIAGEPARTGGSPRPPVAMMMKTSAVADGAATEQMSEQTFNEYHLYTLDGLATLRDRETQSLVMYEPRQVSVKPKYVYRNGDGRGVLAQLDLVNSKAAGPGVPLPAGRVRAFAPDAGKDLQFTGEANIGHIPLDGKFTLDMGYAFDVTGERRSTVEKRISDREREYGVEVVLKNAKSTDVVVIVEESVGGEVEIVSQSSRSTRKDANTLQWAIPVPAGKSATLSYAARQRW